MKNIIAKFSSVLKAFVREDGQDLVEYALLVALISFGVTAGVGSMAIKINSTFSKLGTTLTAAGTTPV
jgi:pilus assembly protein Flp/PilA